MNIYTKKSLIITNKKGYLDKLLSIYPVNKAQMREIPQYIQDDVKKAFKNNKKKELLEAFLKTEKFPVNDPYVASLRHYPLLIKDSPKNIIRISDRLYMYDDSDTLIRMASEPKAPSRQFGNSFHKWLLKIGFKFLDKSAFIKNKSGAFLQGNEENLDIFAKKILGTEPEKRPDFIFKKGDMYYIGEAKFVTDYGGSQDNQVDKALAISKIDTKNVKGIAILDGIIWFPSNIKMHEKIKNSNEYILSALLIKEFLTQL